MQYLINGATTMEYGLADEVLSASKAGFEGGEIWWDKAKKYLEEHSVHEMDTLFKDNNFQPFALCPFLVSPFRRTEELWNDFLQAVEVARAVGCELMTVCPDFQPINLSREEAFKRLSEEFHRYSLKAQEAELRLAVEPIGRHTLVSGPDNALSLIKLAGNPENLGVLIDTFHYMRSQVTVSEILGIPPDKLYIVHVNDCEYGAIDELQDSNRLFPCEGYIDLKTTMNALRSLKYDGAFSVEVFRPSYWKLPVDEITHRAYSSLQKMLAL